MCQSSSKHSLPPPLPSPTNTTHPSIHLSIPACLVAEVGLFPSSQTLIPAPPSLPPSLSRPSLRLSLCICLSFPFPFCFPFLSSIHPLHVVLFFLSPSLCELAASKTIGGEGRGGGFNAPFSSLVNKPVLPRGGMAWHGMTGSVALAMEGETATNPSHREAENESESER